MSFGQVIKGIEWLVVLYCGLHLIVDTKTMRWSGRPAKVIFVISLLPVLVLDIANTFFAKFASLEYTITAVYLFTVIFIFFKVRFWELFVQNFIIWINLKLLRLVTIYFCCFINKDIFIDYINLNSIPWRWLHIFMMLVTVGAMLILYFKIRMRPLVQCQSTGGYILLSILLAIEEFVIDVLFLGGKSAFFNITADYMVLLLFMILLILSGMIIFITVEDYRKVKFQGNSIKMNYEIMKEQYETLLTMHDEKRRQLHDVAQQLIMVSEYIHCGQIDEAQKYIEKSVPKMDVERKCLHTGISAIDLVLDYKMEVAEQYGISVKLNLNIYCCPLDADDMCILMGNLMDNAIEANKTVNEKYRKIHVSMRTVNNMFLLVIKNPYEEKRRIRGGKYMTTKDNRENHGLGLDSVKLIVDKYNGLFEIFDDGSNFEVAITLKNKTKNQPIGVNIY